MRMLKKCAEINHIISNTQFLTICLSPFHIFVSQKFLNKVPLNNSESSQSLCPSEMLLADYVTSYEQGHHIDPQILRSTVIRICSSEKRRVLYISKQQLHIKFYSPFVGYFMVQGSWESQSCLIYILLYHAKMTSIQNKKKQAALFLASANCALFLRYVECLTLSSFQRDKTKFIFQMKTFVLLHFINFTSPRITFLLGKFIGKYRHVFTQNIHKEFYASHNKVYG